MSLLMDIIERFPDKRIVVIGDVILDQYIWGNAQRISPEAPVPIVEVTSETFRLGGAANAAANICSLGGKVDMISVIGDDYNSSLLCQMLIDIGTDVRGVIRDSRSCTTLKTRIIAHQQQVVRIDRESKDEIDDDNRGKIIEYAREAIPNADAVLISDYDKGVLGKQVLNEVISCGNRYGRPVIIDPKRRNLRSYGGAMAITPNLEEASVAADKPIANEEDLICAGRYLYEKLDLRAVLITRGRYGMTLFYGDRSSAIDKVEIRHIPAVAKEVYDVTGAGDTVAVVFTLALTSEASYTQAARISNYAAGIVVGEVGAANVIPEQLVAAMKEVEEDV